MTSPGLIKKSSSPTITVKGNDLKIDAKLNISENEKRIKKIENYFRAICIILEPILLEEEFKPIIQTCINDIQTECNSSKTGRASEITLKIIRQNFENSCNFLINESLISTTEYQEVIQIIHTLAQHEKPSAQPNPLEDKKDKSKVSWFGNIIKTEDIEHLEIFLDLK